MISHLRAKLATLLRGLLVGAAAGWLTMAICNFVAGADRARDLANQLRLGSGIILAAILGGVAGAWLALGGRRRIAGLIGLILGVLAGWALWRMGTPYVWVIDVVLISAFGQGAQYLTGIVALAVLYVLIRWVAIVCESAVLRVLSRPAPPANP